MTDLVAEEDPLPALRKRPRDRKDRILVAAATRFGTAGFRATSVEEIASDVGVTAGALYRHFQSKDHLLATVLTKAVDGLLAETSLSQAETRSTVQGDELRSLVEATVRFAGAQPALYATFVRELRRPATVVAGTVDDAEITEQWHHAVAAAGLRLDATRVEVRLDSTLAALREMVLSADPGELERHRALVTDAFMKVWHAPVVRAKQPARARPRGFDPPVVRSQQILDAALTLFRERGFHDVGMDDIAAAVGMVASGLYRFFPSKSDILLDAYDLVVGHVIAGMDTVLAEAESAADALVGLIELQVQSARSVIDLIVVTEHEGAALPDAERPRLARRRRQILETHLAVLREAHPWLAEPEARILLYGMQPLIRAAASAPANLADPVAELVDMGLALVSAKPINP